MSSPLCPLLRILSLLPNLEVIVPEIGLIKLIPRLTFLLDVPETFPEETDATYVVFGFGTSSYSFETHLSTAVNSFVCVSYFSTIPISFLLLLFFFFSSATTFSASSKVATYTFSCLSSVMA